MKYILLLLLVSCVTTEPIKESPQVVKESQLKTLFPQQAWTDHAFAEVKKSKLVGARVSDPICGKPMTPEMWTHLLVAMAYYESTFRPSHTYLESFKNTKGERILSTGLLQLSYESVGGYGFKVTTQQLKDPFLNLTIGVKILERWVVNDGVIGSQVSPWRGGGRYWSVLRGSGKLKEVRALAARNCQ